jgi:hypothetical protein
MATSAKKKRVLFREKPESPAERKTRLAKREALTLRAFQIAYDNHHPLKSS